MNISQIKYGWHNVWFNYHRSLYECCLDQTEKSKIEAKLKYRAKKLGAPI